MNDELNRQMKHKGVQIISNTDINSIYIGYEPSGVVHLGHYVGLSVLLRLKKLRPDARIKIYLADVHARLNRKNNVSAHVSKMKQFFKVVLPSADVVVGSDVIKDPLYWLKCMDLSTKMNIRAVLRGLPLELKKDVENINSNSFAYCMYTLLQATDPHYFEADTVVAGIDQKNIYTVGYDHYNGLNWSKPNFIFTPLIDMNGRITKDVSQKMSSSKLNIPLDGRLYQTIQKEQRGVKTVLDHICMNDRDLIYACGCESKEEFLEQLKTFIKDLKNFYF